ncbi:MAG TPA: hypothetical protein VM581_03905 [Magnetospirillaceae bacterium]|nr:hypothetical protein [Magnetospirillaceae bacterium]
MKRALLIFIGLAVATSLAWAGVAMAANVRTGDEPRVTSNETIDGTLYAAGTTVRIEGRVQGDLICGGQEVDISGIIEGDVICAAQKITISGEVQGDVRVAAQQNRIEGKVAGSISVIGQQVDVSTNGSIGRDATIVAQQAIINGAVGRDVEAVAETFYTNATLGRHLEVIGTAVSLGDKATVAGDFTYTSAKDATVSSTAHVTGKTDHKIPEAPAMVSTRSYLSSMLISLGSFIVLGIVLLAVAPRFMQATSDAMNTSPLITLGAGFAGLVVPPFVGGMLLLTVIGAPLAALLMLIWLVSLICGLAVSAQTLGKMVVKRFGWNAYIAMAVGLVALFAAAFIPYIGAFVLIIAVIWGVGAQWYVIVAQRTAARTPTKEKS